MKVHMVNQVGGVWGVSVGRTVWGPPGADEPGGGRLGGGQITRFSTHNCTTRNLNWTHMETIYRLLSLSVFHFCIAFAFSEEVPYHWCTSISVLCKWISQCQWRKTVSDSVFLEISHREFFKFCIKDFKLPHLVNYKKKLKLKRCQHF